MTWREPLTRHHRLQDSVISIVQPIIDAFSLSQFCYFSIDTLGNSTCLSTHSAWIEFYLTNNLFVHNPFLKNPESVPEGIFISGALQDTSHHTTKAYREQYGIFDSVIFTRKAKDQLYGYSFGVKDIAKIHLLLNEAPILQKFCSFFEQEASRALYELHLNPINIKDSLDNSVSSNPFRNSSLDTKKKNMLIARFTALQAVSSCVALTQREKECLHFFLEGKSSRRIAEILDLSPRTVESYIENCKSKWGCFSKEELLEKAKLLLPPYFIR